MKSERKIAKVVTKIKLSKSQSDFAFWKTKSYVERLAALEEIRREFHKKDNLSDKVEKAVRLVKLRYD